MAPWRGDAVRLRQYPPLRDFRELPASFEEGDIRFLKYQ